MSPQPPRFPDHRSHLAALRQAALQAADPAAAVRRHFKTADLNGAERVYVVGAGKAGVAMARAAAEEVGARLVAGVLAVPHAPVAAPARLSFIEGGHPEPTEGSLAAGRAIADLLAQTTERDLVLALISGGGSALLEWPRAGLTLDDLRQTNAALLRSGAAVHEINRVRTQLSQIKGGGLARLAQPARVLALILSDVVGNPLASIASGPTVPPDDPVAAAEQALRVVEAYGLRDRLPTAVVEQLERAAAEARGAGLSGAEAGPEPGTPAGRVENRLVASNRAAGEAAVEAARALGFEAQLVADDWQGEAREAGRRLAGLALQARPANHQQPPRCLVVGGETTVTVRGQGRGGRNQEVALAAAQAIAGQPNVAIATFATDGVDGPTNAAGAIVTGETIARARALGLDPQRHLDDNNAYPLLQAVDALLITGPTGTNVNDLMFALAYA